MAIRLEPQDEYMHELGPEPNFNESMYFNLYDPTNRLGGWFLVIAGQRVPGDRRRHAGKCLCDRLDGLDGWMDGMAARADAGLPL